MVQSRINLLVGCDLYWLLTTGAFIVRECYTVHHPRIPPLLASHRLSILAITYKYKVLVEAH